MPTGKKQIFLGVDPGLADVGFGLIAQEKGKLKIIAYGSIKTKKETAPAERLKQIASRLDKIIKKYKPNFTAVEKLFFCKNIKTGIAVGQSRGVIILTIIKNKLPMAEFTPLQVKQAVTGYGRAEKGQVQQMVKIILNLKEAPKPDDAADALAVAICAASSLALMSLKK
ncbi:crossover junction endodeoxyribonuclease RuvC [Candidatus Falkowbacteria bacterium]|nr:crossover junction endodeoxyribonuclease RuvC [Candidatus Falkowbacteria bacterium]